MSGIIQQRTGCVADLRYFGQFDVLSGAVAWLLAPDAGLRPTTDGMTWRGADGPGPSA